jgi:hypothetical protein
MKQLPDWERVQQRMQPGQLTRDGMLGSDKRTLPEIIDADNVTVSRLGLTHDDIADRLLSLQKAARERLGDAVVVNGIYEVRADESRGILPCPFGHPGGRFRKCVTYLRHLPTGKTIQWTDLGIHMIREHGFYEGKGATFRLEPDELVELLHISGEEQIKQL